MASDKLTPEDQRSFQVKTRYGLTKGFRSKKAAEAFQKNHDEVIAAHGGEPRSFVRLAM